MIVDTVRHFVEKEIYPHENKVEELGYVPQEIADDIKTKVLDMGFLLVQLPWRTLLLVNFQGLKSKDLIWRTPIQGL